MTPLALMPPVTEPVSLTQAKAFLRLDQQDEDDLVATLVTAARLMVEAASGRMLIAQRWRVVLDAWPRERSIRLPLSPVSAIVAGRVYDALGIAQPIAASALQLDQAADPPLIHLVGETPETGRARGAIEIDLVVGFGASADDVPAPLRQAVLLLAARWFEQRGDVVGRNATTLPPEIMALVAPFRRARL